ncbi:MAG: hypothetical protein COB46_05745 [Rhodospirillaceae bacterium]|nr:MAG: hypothetical protein COB46_05745 [Rhodospirillaceae bacterium]
MQKNVGSIDKVLRIIIGLALLAYAILPSFGMMADTGYNVYGWVGIVPLGTALLGLCPLYSILGIKTCSSCASDEKEA